MSELLESLEAMLRRRRNVQSKHGEQAAYSHEVFLLIEALEKLLDAQLPPSALPNESTKET